MDTINLSQLEKNVIKLKDIDKLKDKDCAEILGISKSEYKILLHLTRNKIANSITNDNEIVIHIEEEIIQEICETLCRFRCATCSKIYAIDYTKENIVCPLCGSSKIMKLEEMGKI